jgi:hypothetical protein
MSKKSALGIFFRIPLYGKVKKRLAAEIGESEALKAYESMLKATIDNVSRLHDIDIYGFYEGEETSFNSSLPPFNSPLTKVGYRVVEEGSRGFPGEIPLYSQQGVDLGERMCNAVKLFFNKGYEKVSLIGADSPDLPFAFITEAFEKLDSYDLAIGPSEDGGYYLISMNKPFDTIFKDINWGHENVLKDTVSKTKAAGISYFLLPEWYDIDDLNSLNRWKLKNLAFSERDKNLKSR